MHPRGGEHVEKEELFRHAAEAGNSGAMTNLGAAVRDRGEVIEAEEWFRRAAVAGDAGAMVNLGTLLQGRGELGEAEEWWRQAVAAGQAYDQLAARFSDPASLELHVQLARALLEVGLILDHCGRRREKVEVYDRIVTRFSEASEPELRELAGQARFRRGMATLGIEQEVRHAESADEE